MLVQPGNPSKILQITWWKALGPDASPNGNLRNRKHPIWLMNDVMSLVSWASSSCVYPHSRSILLNTVLPASFSDISSIVGRGYRSGITALFTEVRLTHRLTPPSLFLATTKLLIQGLAVIGSMTPSASMRLSSAAIGSRMVRGGCQNFCCTGCIVLLIFGR